MRNLRVQLLISHLTLVVLLGLVMSALVRSTFLIGKSMDTVIGQNVPGLLAAQELQQQLALQDSAMNSLLSLDIATARKDFVPSWKHFREILDATDEIGNADHTFALRETRILAERYEAKSRSILFTTPPKSVRDAEENYALEIRPLLYRLALNVNKIAQFHASEISRTNQRVKHDAQTAAGWSMVVVAFTLVLAIGLSYTTVRLALSPLKRFSDQIELIGQGDFSHRLNVKRTDEIGTLASTFNQMVDQLEEYKRKQQRQLLRAERMADVALESLYDPVVITDASGRIVFLNHAAEGLWGPSPTVPRLPIVEHVSDRRIIRAIQSVIEGKQVGKEDDAETLLPIRVAGKQRTYRLRTTPMNETDGRLLGTVTVLEDITHLKELDRMKDEFVGVASHELKTPIQSLLLSAQLLKDGAAGTLTPTQDEVVSAQLQDLERLDRLTRELLDLTRLEAGSVPPRFELVPPSDLIQSVVKNLSHKAEVKGVHINVECPGGLPNVRADRSQIGRVLINLVDNAIRHTPGGGSVAVRAKAKDDAVLIQVEDTGEGIPESYVKSIFDRFVQVPGATQGGAGLGLAISGTIVKAHGSELTVQSELGKGSLFEFMLRTDLLRQEEEAS